MTIDWNFIFGAGGLAVGVLGVVLAIIFYFRGKSKKVLEYHVTSTKLITEDIADIPNFEISIGGESASDLTSTTVDFVNTGNATIHLSDIASKAPIQLTSSGHFFNASEIDERYIRSNNECLNQSVSIIDNNKIVIGFEYLEPRQTFSITIWHDGEISVSGKLKSGKFRCSSSIEHSNGTRSFASKSSFLFSSVVAGSLSVLLAFLLAYNIQLSRELSTLKERYAILLTESTSWCMQDEGYQRALERLIEALDLYLKDN